MSTQPNTPAQWQPITEENQPGFPCEMLHPKLGAIKVAACKQGYAEWLRYGWTHHRPTAPTAQPEQPRENESGNMSDSNGMLPEYPAATGTPRTDKAFDHFPTGDSPSVERRVESARASHGQLERDLNAARAEVETAKAERQAALNVVQDLKQNCASMEAEVERLTRERDEARADHSIVLQDLAEAINDNKILRKDVEQLETHLTLLQSHDIPELRVEIERWKNWHGLLKGDYNALSAQLAASRPTVEMVDACAKEIESVDLPTMSRFGTIEGCRLARKVTITAIIAKHFNPEKKP